MTTISNDHETRAFVTAMMAQLAKRAQALGFNVVRSTNIEQNEFVLYIDLPEGQVTYHYNWNERFLFQQFPLTSDLAYAIPNKATNEPGMSTDQAIVRTCQFRSLSCTEEGCMTHSYKDLCQWLQKNRIEPSDVYEVLRLPMETLENGTFSCATRVTWLQRKPATVDTDLV